MIFCEWWSLSKLFCLSNAYTCTAIQYVKHCQVIIKRGICELVNFFVVENLLSICSLGEACSYVRLNICVIFILTFVTNFLSPKLSKKYLYHIHSQSTHIYFLRNHNFLAFFLIYMHCVFACKKCQRLIKGFRRAGRGHF